MKTEVSATVSLSFVWYFKGLEEKSVNPEKSESKPVETEVNQSTLAVSMEEEVFSLGYIPLDIFAKKLKVSRRH